MITADHTSTSRLAELRTSRGWTQEHLAVVSGLTVRTVQRVEAGRRASLDTASRLGAALGVPVDDLRQDAAGLGAGSVGGDPASVGLDEARRFARAARRAGDLVATAVALFVVAPVPVVVSIALTDAGVVPASVEAGIAVGLGALLLLAAIGALLVVRASGLLSTFRALRSTRPTIDDQAARWVTRLASARRHRRSAAWAVAAVLWVLSPLPLVVVALLGSEGLQGLGIAGATVVLLLTVAAGLVVVLRTSWSRSVEEALLTGR